MGPHDYVLSADEKTSIQARGRCPASYPPAPGRPPQVEFEYERHGALQYLAAWDLRRGVVFGRCDAHTGLDPFGRLVEHVMHWAPYRTAARAFWLVDNGSPPLRPWDTQANRAGRRFGMVFCREPQLSLRGHWR